MELWETAKVTNVADADSILDLAASPIVNIPMQLVSGVKVGPQAVFVKLFVVSLIL
jgi:hypothetical protein